MLSEGTIEQSSVVYVLCDSTEGHGLFDEDGVELSGEVRD